jgi:hypothetical protein
MCVKAESLNAVKQWFLIRKQKEYAAKIERFQNEEDSPYEEQSGAAAILVNNLYDETILKSTQTIHHPNEKNLSIWSSEVII